MLSNDERDDFWSTFTVESSEMSLKLIPLHLDFISNFDDMTLVLTNVKITFIMPCYDFIVKFRNFDLADLFEP